MSLYATINNFIAENAIIFSVFIPIISGAIGAYVSYKITIKSDKRKEYNEYVEPLYLVLNDFYYSIKNDHLPELPIDPKIINQAIIKLPDRDKARLENLINDLINYYELNTQKWVKYSEGFAVIFIENKQLKEIKLKVNSILELINFK